MPPHFTLHVDDLDQEFAVVRVDGVERLSDLFRFELEIATAVGKVVAFEDVLGRAVTLTLRWEDLATRSVHGIVWELEQHDVTPAHAHFRMVIVPWVRRLELRRDCRIFQDRSVAEIVRDVLRDAGLPADRFRFELGLAHPVRRYCVQYRESDWAFISRLLEEEGICYFFEHDAVGCALVMADSPGAHPAITLDESVPYRIPDGLAPDTEHVTEFRFGRALAVTKVSLADFNPLDPDRRLQCASDRADAATLDAFDYPGGYENLPAGAARATLRLEEARVQAATGSGKSVCVRFGAGATCRLQHHPRADFNQRYLLTSVIHRGEQHQVLHEEGHGPPSHYQNEFTCMLAAMPFRPVRRTPRPTISSVQTAIVVGPATEEIYTDEHGRVKVRFHWDRASRGDERSSCWIRVSQESAGAEWGALVLPRVGHEVVVSFVDGDPDRPLITGRVYNGRLHPPYPLPAEKTRTTFRTRSTPGGDAGNELSFEDAAGAEEVFLHGRRNWRIHVEHDKNQTIDHDEHHTVGGNQTGTINGHRVLAVQMTSTEAVTLAKTLSIGAAYQVTVGAAMNTSVGAAQLEEVARSKTVVVGDKFELICGAGKLIIEKSGKVTLQGTSFEFVASGTVTINGSVIDLN